MNKQKIYFCTAFARVDLIKKLAKIYNVICIFPKKSRYAIEISKLTNFALNNEIEYFQVKKSELENREFNVLQEVMDTFARTALTATPQDYSFACTHLAPRNPNDNEASKEPSLLQSYVISRAHKEDYPTFFELSNHTIFVKFEVSL